MNFKHNIMSSISFAGFDAEAKLGPVGQVKQAVVRSGVNAALHNSGSTMLPPTSNKRYHI